MASVAEVLEHLVQNAPGLSADRRQEFLDAIGAEPALAADRAGQEQPEPAQQADQPPAEQQVPQGY